MLRRGWVCRCCARAMIVRFLGVLLNCLTGDDEVELPRRKATPNGRAQIPSTTRPPADDSLLPGLPNSLVLLCILPRIPWHVRPLLRATSMAWSQTLDALSPHDSSLARLISRKNFDDIRSLKGGQNLVRVQNLIGSEHVISLYDRAQERWRNLPTLPCGSLPPMCIHANFLGTREYVNSIQVDYISGKVIAAAICEGFEDDTVAHVWILDIEGGMWKWEKQPSIHTKNPLCLSCLGKMIEMDGKVFMTRHGLWDDNKPLVYDVARDEWIQLPDPIHDLARRWFYTIRIGSMNKFVFAVGAHRMIDNPEGLDKFLEPKTMRWMDFRLE